jgi:hypothetical protein
LGRGVFDWCGDRFFGSLGHGFFLGGDALGLNSLTECRLGIQLGLGPNRSDGN